DVGVVCAVWCLGCLFFFSSRRRHTRFSRDWSSDVCSSDLKRPASAEIMMGAGAVAQRVVLPTPDGPYTSILTPWSWAAWSVVVRSEERRVGKECGSRWVADNVR